MRHEVIIGVERRRFWPDEQKLSILSEVGVGGATVADVARRHDITRQHIYQWRRQLRDRGLWPDSAGTTFLTFDGPEAMPSEAPLAPSGTVEIVLANGRVLRSTGGICDEDLARLIRVVEAA
jgi:transposase